MLNNIEDVNEINQIAEFLESLTLSDFKIDNTFNENEMSTEKIFDDGYGLAKYYVPLDDKYKVTTFLNYERYAKYYKDCSIGRLLNDGYLSQVSIFKKSNNMECTFIKVFKKKFTIIFYRDKDAIMHSISIASNYF